MPKVLIVDDDLSLQQLLKFTLQKFKNSFEIVFAGNGVEAVELLKKQSFQLLVTDIKMPEMDGLALLSHVSSHYPALPCIVLTSYNIPGLEQNLAGAVLKFYKKPVNPEELAESIIHGLKQKEKNGAGGGVSLTGLIQIIEAEQKTCELVVSRQVKEIGRLYLLEGELIHAVYGKVTGKQAAVELMGLENVQTSYNPGLPEPAPTRTIHDGLQGLILEAMRLKDEKQTTTVADDSPHLEQELLEQGIQLCEGLHFTKAQKPLIALLRRNKNNVDALKWLARCMNSKKKTKIILQKLYRLAPNDSEIAVDIRKFHIAEGLCKERIIHCPFCYTMLSPAAVRCSHCRSYVVMSEEISRQLGKNSNRRELDKAIKRFESVLVRELNIPVLFYIGMAYMNLNDYNSALTYFEQLQECVGSAKNIYTATVQRILTYIATRQDAMVEAVLPGTATGQDADAAGKTGDEVSEKASAEKMLPGLKKVLVVEDSPTTRKVIKMTLLEAKKYIVIEAGDGMEALNKLNDEQPDLVLLDVMLPSLDGYGILSLLKKNENLKKVPVIMLTSKDRFRDKLRGRFSAASAYLTKPFEPKKLLDEVEKYLPAG